MKLRAKNFGMRTGFTKAVAIHRTDASALDLHASDRVVVKAGKKKIVAVLDVLDHLRDPTAVIHLQHGELGFFTEAWEALKLKDGTPVTIAPDKKPASIKIIKKKLNGGEMHESEIKRLVKDIVDGELTGSELTYFVSAAKIRGLNFEEIAYLTKAIATTGAQFRTRKRPVVDKHCIGGVPGNRTTMILVPILAAFGLTVPKTSSRAITSPAGTADVMECVANVGISLDKMQHIVRKTNACIVWGGAISLALADNKIVRVERPLSLECTGLMLSSVLAKKASVGATHVIIDIPFGKGTKVEKRSQAEELRQHFLTLGKLLGMKIEVVLTDGRQPVGNGIGPLLEYRDVMKVLRREKDAPKDLRAKSLMLAGTMLEFLGAVKKGLGRQVAREILDSGDALKKFEEIVSAQGRKPVPPLPRHRRTVLASKTGKVVEINNKMITKLTRFAGSPVTKEAGVYLHKKVGDTVKKGEPIYTIYSGSSFRLKNAATYSKQAQPYKIR